MRRLTLLGVALYALLAAPAQAQEHYSLTIAPQHNAVYDRESDYGGGWWRWGCADVRQRVLELESYVPVVKDEDCRIVHGVWFDPFTEKWFTDPGLLDVDHLVPLKEAHRSGAHAWTDQKRRSYANDVQNPGHLIAVDRSANRAKGDKDPSEWLPPNEDFHCAYVLAWMGVKQRWELSADVVEYEAIRDVLEDCL